MLRAVILATALLTLPTNPRLAFGQECDPLIPCSGNGDCDTDGSCICDAGYEGDMCETPICVQPCINGICTAPDFCECDPGWFGLICSNPICNPNCVMGFCIGPDTCACLLGWTGALCDEPACNPDCVLGTCVAPDTCQCDQGWTGPICNQDIDECASGVCDANATCTNLPGSFTCECNAGYVGSGLAGDCTDVDECLDDPCPLNATCNNLPGTFGCPCNVGWTGLFCDIPVCNPACVHGMCVDPDICACDLGWTGVVCTQDVDECFDDPCDIDATCTNVPGSFTCECNVGYVGGGLAGDCTDVNECLDEPCPANATCENLPGSFECPCDFGWLGANCDVPVCDPACVNGACVEPDACVCEPGWTGADCSVLPGLEVDLDIKPGACPNTMKGKKENKGKGKGNDEVKGNLSVALVGTAGFDVSEVDLSTLALSRVDGVGDIVAPLEGPPGPHSTLDDLATPSAGDACDCHSLEGDGLLDVHMTFSNADLFEALELDDLAEGTLLKLQLTGTLFDGTPFAATDCIEMK